MQRYNNLSTYMKKTFGEKILKVSIDGGFTCPNRLNEKKVVFFVVMKVQESLQEVGDYL